MACQKIQGDRVVIIAEVGVNHNGRIELARDLIDAASVAGADAVKFQTFQPDTLVVKGAEKAAYQKETTGKNESQYDMLEKLALPPETFTALRLHCRTKGIRFLSSPFSEEDIDVLERLDMETYKIPSGQITDLPYLRKIGSLRKDIYLSTGMASLYEIKAALEILTSAGTPKERIVLLHCNTAYPTPIEDANLHAMRTLKEAFHVNVGYSDHTIGIEIAIAAVAMGAAVVEKHFTLDKSMEGPDHRASMDPEELTRLVRGIRNVERALGDGRKRVTESEMQNREIVRKSIVAAVPIAAGEIFTEANLTTKRPATGMSPMQWNEIIGTVARRNFLPDDPI